jgi:hypothetical protein
MESEDIDPSRSTARSELNPRQLELVLYALRHPGSEFTTASHQRAQGLDPHTARADLVGLAEQGYLRKHRIGRAYVFYPADDLGQRIAGLA